MAKKKKREHTGVDIDENCRVEKMYGSNAPKTQLIRTYRDEVLQNSPLGRLTISLYYSKPGRVLTNLLPEEPTRKTLDWCIKNIIEPTPELIPYPI